MIDRIVNMLIVEEDETQLSSLITMIQNPGHNIFVARDLATARNLISRKPFVLIFCSLDFTDEGHQSFLTELEKGKVAKQSTLILISKELEKIHTTIGTYHGGTVDYLLKPFVFSVVKTKISVYKQLHFKHKRVRSLLESILPAQTLEEFNLYGKSSPKKKNNCSILFTDFVNFSQKNKHNDPQDIVKRLDYYFSHFDRIIQNYHLEKIKTIGDAYMVVGGVTEDDPHPAIRMALAALEIRNFMVQDTLKQKEAGKSVWEIRIGIHAGDLVAGVVGRHKFSFDVWGDSVNIAARCEQHSIPGKITVSDTFHRLITPYFKVTSRGKIKVKNGGEIDMFFLDGLQPDFTLHHKGIVPNLNFRRSVGLPLIDFQGIRTFILDLLKTKLDPQLHYHSWKHAKHVERAVVKYGQLEGLSTHELLLVRTAALFHDSGFLVRYDGNEIYAVELIQQHAPQYGYSDSDVAIMASIIMATAPQSTPQNLLEEIMCDADLDYLGRIDYHVTADKLFREMAEFGYVLNKKEKIEAQIDYLKNIHHYYTTSAQNLRNPGKQNRLRELQFQLKRLGE